MTPKEPDAFGALSDIAAARIQGPKWQGYRETSRPWPTPRAIELVAEGLAANVPQKVLVCGCGGAGSEAFAYAQGFPQTAIVGFDINKQALAEARERAASLGLAARLSFLAGDMLDGYFVDNHFPAETFGVITMLGIGTNLIDDGTLRLALTNLRLPLAVGGSLVFSDYLMMPEVPYWKQRYERDYRAISITQMHAARGTLVIRPNGLSALDCLRLSPEEVATCLATDRFERLARHRKRETLERLLELAGYRLSGEIPTVKLVSDHNPDPDEPWNLALNYTVRATKSAI